MADADDEALDVEVGAGADRARHKPSLRSRVFKVLLALAVVVVTYAVVVPQIADYGDVFDSIGAMSGWATVVVAVAAVANIVTFAPTVMAALPGLTYRQAMELQMAATALSNVLPAGGAFTFGIQYQMLRVWGFRRRAIAMFLVVSGIWNTYFNLGIPVVALGLLTVKGGRNAALQQAAGVGLVALVASLVAFALVLRSDDLARWVGRRADRLLTGVRRVVRKPAVVGSADTLVRFRHESLDLLRRRWLALTLSTVGGTMTVFGVLLACLRGVGVPGAEVTVTEALAAWAVVRLLTAIPLAPGGIGIQELGLIGTLTAFGGSEDGVVAAVLMFRVLTWVPVVLLGGVAAFTWRRHHPADPLVAQDPMADLDTDPGRPS